MNLSRNRILAAIIMMLLAVLAAAPAGAIPGKILISGQLLDKDGNPVHYTTPTLSGPQEISVGLAARVMLYDSATAPAAFAIIPTTATAYNAYFNISFTLPDTAVTKDSLWYALSIDVANDGLSSSDFFPDRFEIGSVPFALSARPVTFFTTFSGSKEGGGSYYRFANIMNVCPFETPPGGVEFNQMNIILFLGMPNSAFSFGIYDESGVLVVSSGLITIKGVEMSESFLQVKHQTVKLMPSKIYYVGIARNNTGTYFANGLRPAAPIMGTVAIPKADGSIPVSFSPSKIVPDTSIYYLPVTLCLVADDATSGTKWEQAKPGQPQYRWIPAQPSAK